VEYKDMYSAENLFKQRLNQMEDKFQLVTFFDITGSITQADTLLKEIETSIYSFPALKTETRALIFSAVEKQSEFMIQAKIGDLIEKHGALRLKY
jgi:hypothetical protein